MVNLIKIGNTYNVPIKFFEVDSASEISSLPTTGIPVGSVCTDLGTGNIYKFKSTGEWAILPSRTININVPIAEEEEF